MNIEVYVHVCPFSFLNADEENQEITFNVRVFVSTLYLY